MWGLCPHLERGLGAKPPILGCFCAYIGGCRGISANFIFPTQNPRFCLLGGWKGSAQVFANNHTKSVVGKVLLKFFIDNHTKSKSYFSDF